MVEDTVDNGKRIAQLLASECSGLELGALADVTVADASPDANPSGDGTRAYRLAYRAETVAVVSMFPDHARLSWVHDVAAPASHAQSDQLTVSGNDIAIHSGAGVKPAVDAVRSVLEQVERESDAGSGAGTGRRNGR
jgi:hypothetical protein